MLNEIVAYKRKQLQGIAIIPEIDKFKSIIESMPPAISMKKSLKSERGTSIIAEIKRRSPSKGVLISEIDVKSMAEFYERAGARAISVLTEDKFFGGSIEDLITVKKSTSLPVLRKDFIIDEYQIWQSRAIGADAILIIVKILTSDELHHFCYLARQLGLEIIVEVHNAAEMGIANTLKPNMIGINNRDLLSFKTDIKTFETLVDNMPYNTLSVSESGIFTRSDILYLQSWGADAVLVGEGIITSPDPYSKICELRGIET